MSLLLSTHPTSLRFMQPLRISVDFCHLEAYATYFAFSPFSFREVWQMYKVYLEKTTVREPFLYDNLSNYKSIHLKTINLNEIRLWITHN